VIKVSQNDVNLAVSCCINMAAAFVLAIAGIIAAALLAWLLWSVYKHGWAGTIRNIRGCPGALPGFLRSRARWAYNAIGQVAEEGRRSRGGTKGSAELEFVWVSDASHFCKVIYPADWHLARSEGELSSLLLQATCDSTTEETYKRLSVAWDDISWSTTTATEFGRGIVANLTTLLPGAQLVSSGPFDLSRGHQDRPFQLTYRVTDPSDRTQMELFNVVFTSTLGARRRAYTVTFGCDARASRDLNALANHLIGSFSLGDGLGPDNRAHRGYSTDSGGSDPRLRGLQLDDEDRRLVKSHVPVWERERNKAVAAGASSSVPASAPASPAAGAGAGAGAQHFAGDTPQDIARIGWTGALLEEAGLTYKHPAAWGFSGVGHDESPGFAPIATHAVRRWCVAHTCDRRETSFKQIGVVCADLTPLLEVINGRVAGNPAALEGAGSAGKLLLLYVAYRYRAELAEMESLAAGRVPSLPPLLSTEQALRPWVDAFVQKWPPTVRVSHPVSASTAGRLSVPQQTAVTEMRPIGNSILLKVSGWLRTAGTGVGGVSGLHAAPAAASERSLDSSPRHHDSSYSTISSLDLESAPAEGLLLNTTSAVLVGVHEAMVPTGAPVRRGAPPALAKRTFGHVVSCSFSSEAFSAYEPLTKAVLQSLEAVAPTAGTRR